jgi:hypothetical protein
VTHGLKSVPLYATLAAIALGAKRVDFASNDDEVHEVAERLGARPIRTEFEGGTPLPHRCRRRPHAHGPQVRDPIDRARGHL